MSSQKTRSLVGRCLRHRLPPHRHGNCLPINGKSLHVAAGALIPLFFNDSDRENKKLLEIYIYIFFHKKVLVNPTGVAVRFAPFEVGLAGRSAVSGQIDGCGGVHVIYGGGISTSILWDVRKKENQIKREFEPKFFFLFSFLFFIF